MTAFLLGAAGAITVMAIVGVVVAVGFAKASAALAG